MRGCWAFCHKLSFARKLPLVARGGDCKIEKSANSRAGVCTLLYSRGLPGPTRLCVVLYCVDGHARRSSKIPVASREASRGADCCSKFTRKQNTSNTNNTTNKYHVEIEIVSTHIGSTTRCTRTQYRLQIKYYGSPTFMNETGNGSCLPRDSTNWPIALEFRP